MSRLELLNRLSFQKKMLIFMMAVVIFMGGAMGLLIRSIIFPFLVREMEGGCLNAARRVAESARTAILVRDIASIAALLFDEKHHEKSIAYILVTDREGKILAHTFLVNHPEIREAHRHASHDSFSSGPGRFKSVTGDITSEITVPVYEGYYQIGTVHVGLDEHFIRDVLSGLSYYHLGFTAFITVAGLIFGLFLSRVITRPIASLTAAAREISLGNLNTRIMLGSGEAGRERAGCEEKGCPARVDGSLPCRFVDDTDCDHASHACPESLEICGGCDAYKSVAGDELVQLADMFNHMARRLQISEMELRRSEERYRLLFESDPNPVFVVSLDSYAILDVNDRAVQAYGYSKDRLIGMVFTELGYEDESLLVVKAFNAIDWGSKSSELLPRIRHRKSSGFTFWVNIYFCVYEHLGMHSVIATSTDITEIIETETRLIQAGKMATLGEMSAGVAHELNQPLNAIKLGSEYLQKMTEEGRPIPENDLHELAADISSEVDRASNIINHLREFGRKSRIAREKMDLNKPIRGVFTILGQQLMVHGIKVILDLDESLPPVLADDNRIEQVLINLVNNSRDAMLECEDLHGPPIGTLTVRSFAEKDRVVVTVSDTGAGIPLPIRERIFEPFFTTKEVGKGTGLGLSISYGIVRDFGGSIDFESEEGMGTTFRLSLPRAPEENQNDRNGSHRQDPRH
jgi:PAS domain S-box-containing protein